VLKLNGIEHVRKGLEQAIPYENYLKQTPPQIHLKSLLAQPDLPVDNLKTPNQDLVHSAVQAVAFSQLQSSLLEDKRGAAPLDRAKEFHQEDVSEANYSLPASKGPEKEREVDL